MAGGPLFPHSFFPDKDAYSNSPDHWVTGIYEGNGANSKHEEMYCYRSSPFTNARAEWRYHLPPVFPTGTPKLRIVWITAATSGSFLGNVGWEQIPVGGGATARFNLPSDNVTNFLSSPWGETMSAGNANKYHEEVRQLPDSQTGPLEAGNVLTLSLMMLGSSSHNDHIYLMPTLVWA